MLYSLAVLRLGLQKGRDCILCLVVLPNRKITLAEIVPENALLSDVVGQRKTLFKIFNRLRKIFQRHVDNTQSIIRLHEVPVTLNGLLQKVDRLRELTPYPKVVGFRIVLDRLSVFRRKRHLAINRACDQKEYYE